MFYLLDETCRVLLMEAELGLPAWDTKPWTRVRVDAGVPVAAAVRRDELIWVPSPGDMARRFPATALSAPYPVALAAAPIRADARVHGSWALMWPESHPAGLSLGELAAINRTSERFGRLLANAGAEGRPLRALGQPRTLTAPPAITPDAQWGPAALDCLNRFTDGIAAIDIQGHLTFCNPAAAHLFGLHGPPAWGYRLWDRVPWLHDPAFAHCYRAAVIGQQPTSCLAAPPGGRLLKIRLHPAPSGISLHITPAQAGEHRQEEYAAGGRRSTAIERLP
ncbi:PAS domain-containing protein [Nonomuraea fuscirosea]|uniref:PAS domain-containing protein n=1 Tax=Nonomuraea fuscirosea TaxID=1291556 RepID=UPI002DD812A9|nr:PAS domain-containing protein [Nonomuraea fuscirosea]WSA50015.1 PAS domain-containing protein [Nonomuraea fuscirosea]